MKRRTVLSIVGVLAIVSTVVAAQNAASLLRKDLGVSVYPGAQFDQPMGQFLAELTAQQMKLGPLPAGAGFALYTTRDDIVKVAAHYRGVLPGEDMEIQTKTGAELRKELQDSAALATNPTYKANIQALVSKLTEGKTAVAMSMQKGNMVLVSLSSPIADITTGQVRPGTLIWISVLPQK